MADETIKIKIDVDGVDNISKDMNSATESTKNLRVQLKEARDELQALSTTPGVDPEKVQEAAQKVGELKDAIANANEQANLFASGSKYERVTRSFGSIGTAIKNLDFEKAQERATAFAKMAASINFNDAVKSAKQLGQTFMTIGKAILTNPLFLLAAVIIAIVAAVVKLLDEIGVLRVIMDALGKVFEWIMIPINALIDGLKSLTDWFGWTNNAGEAAADGLAESAQKSADQQKKASESIIQGLDNQIRLRKLEGKETTDLERQKVRSIRDTARAQFEADVAFFRAAKLKGKLSKEEMDDLREKIRLQELATNQAIMDVTFFEKRVVAEKKKAGEEASKNAADQEEKDKAKRSAAYAARIQREKEFLKNRLGAERQIEDLKVALMNDDVQKEIVLNDVKYRRLIENTVANENLLQSEKEAIIKSFEAQRDATEIAIRERDRLNKERQAAMDAQKELSDMRATQALRLNFIDDEIKKERLQTLIKYQDDLLNLEEALKNELITREQYDQMVIVATERKNKEINDINQRAADAEAAREKKLQDLKMQAVGNTLSTISNLTELFNDGSEKSARKAFEIQKGVSIAETAMATFKSAQSAFSSLAGIPIVGPALGAVAATAAVTAGLANIKKIASQKFDGGGETGRPSVPSFNAGSSGSTPQSAPTPPSVTLFGNANDQGQQGSQQAGLRQQTMIKAFVVESDVTNTQNTLSQYQERSEIG